MGMNMFNPSLDLPMNFKTLMPMTLPFSSSKGPPLLPGDTAASD